MPAPLRIFLVFLCIIFCKTLCFADSKTPQEKEPIKNSTQFTRNYSYYSWSRVKKSFTSPVTTPAYKGLLTGLGSVALLLATRETTVDPLQESMSTRKPLGETSKWGDLLGQLIPNALYAGGMYSYGAWGNNKQALERSYFMIEATAYSGIFTMIAKTIAHEKRPNGSDYRSFPSGHATTAFSFAAAVGIEHGWEWGIPAYGLAGFVGASRINDNKHYLHDVVAGATVGITYAYGLHYYHHQIDKKINPEKKEGMAFIGLLPFTSDHYAAQGLTALFEF